MNISTKITVRLFVGCRVTSEIRMYVRQSISWKNASILPSGQSLIEVRHQGNDYIGRYLEKEKLTINDLAAVQLEIKKKLQEYFPRLESENFPLSIFPQVLIA